MKYIRGFLMAWGNFSAVPCPYHKWHEESRKAMLAMLPLVGLMLAVIVCVAWWLLDLGSMNSIFTGVAITAIYFYCNGFIHMDGFMDCSDAILSRRPELEERQRILKASDVGAFAVTVSESFVEELEQLKLSGEQYKSLLMQSLGDRLVEAASEWLHEQVRKKLWGYAPVENLTIKEMYQAAYQGIRPAVGYPSLPDQKTILPLAELLDLGKIGITLTENGAMYPQASVCGLYIASRHAKYFVIR